MKNVDRRFIPLFVNIYLTCIDSLSFAYQLECERVKLTAEHRRALGLTTTVYTCGAQCSALANEPYEGLYSLLYIAKCRADGFLRWALDAFNDFPLEDSYHLPFAAGDIYLIYPDLKTSERREAKSSARYEVIAEGCRLLAKINYLRNFSDDLRKKTDLLVDSLGSLNEGDAELEALRVKAGIEELSRLAASNACR